MHYDQLPKPRVLAEYMPPLRDGDTFDVLGYTFTVVQVCGPAAYIQPAGALRSRRCDLQQLQALLARIGMPRP